MIAKSVKSFQHPHCNPTEQKPGKLYTVRVLGLLLEEYKQKHCKLDGKA